ncbi:hypothetical protein HK101_009148 [Irineochytrium annulatum]|nr:hypothetical protein HK101_009148 [Irineochytrium annulatum]
MDELALQLQQIDEMLAINPGNADILALRADLESLIELQRAADETSGPAPDAAPEAQAIFTAGDACSIPVALGSRMIFLPAHIASVTATHATVMHTIPLSASAPTSVPLAQLLPLSVSMGPAADREGGLYEAGVEVLAERGGVFGPAVVLRCDGGEVQVRFGTGKGAARCWVTADRLFPVVDSGVTVSGAARSKQEEQEEDDESDDENEWDEPMMAEGVAECFRRDTSGRRVFTFEDGVEMGRWERYSSDVASRYLAKMGYVEGRGLGKHGHGIVEPIKAVILPPNKGLGFATPTEVKMKRKPRAPQTSSTKKQKTNHEDAGMSSVFGFLNKTLHKPGADYSPVSTTDLKSAPETDGRPKGTQRPPARRPADAKAIRVELMQLSKKESAIKSEIKQTKESIARNAKDKVMKSQKEAMLRKLETKLAEVVAQEAKLQGHLKGDLDRKKMVVF